MPSAADDYLARAEELVYPTDAYIDGKRTPAESGKRFACVSPRNGAVLAEISECGAADIDRAVQAARGAFESGSWSEASPQKRRTTLLRLAWLIEQHSEELALLETLDMGKPIRDSRGVDIPLARRSFEFYAEAIDKLYDEVAPTSRDVLATVTREPIGVVGAVVPWNFPLMLTSWKVAPALAAGNSVVLKPAEQSPLTALRLADLAEEAGLPPGVLNVVPGFGPEAGAALGRHKDVDVLTFTGSGEVGRRFLEYSAESNMKPVWLECGGKNPQIVFPDADLDRAAAGVVGGILHNQGQVCAAGSRLLVHESIHDELLENVLAGAREWRIGDPLDPQVQLGALVEEAHLNRVLQHIGNAEEDGAELVLGGNQVLAETGGWYVEPTVFDRVGGDARLAAEEVFGPVLAVQEFSDTAEAIELANNTRFGLAAAVWTRDLSTGHRVSRDLRAGSVWVNNFNDSDITTPFGGYKESGHGRDRSLHALEKFTQLKTTWVQL